MKQTNELTGRSEKRETAYEWRAMPIPSCFLCAVNTYALFQNLVDMGACQMASREHYIRVRLERYLHLGKGSVTPGPSCKCSSVDTWPQSWPRVIRDGGHGGQKRTTQIRQDSSCRDRRAGL